jgi:glycosyltransferase involved in cell wall biosynthesis
VGESGRVLQLLGPSTGGIRRHVTFLTDALREQGWAVEIAGPPRVLDGLGMLDHVVAIPGGPRPVASMRAVSALRRLLPGYDLVHAHGLTAGWLASLARRGDKPALVVTVHNVVLREAAGRATPLLRYLERRLPARVDQVIAVSPEIATYLAAGAPVTTIGAFGPRPQPRRTPAQVRAALGVDDAAPLVVCVARLHPQKGLDLLLDAWPSVAAAAPSARLVLVGEGPLEEALRADAARLAVSARPVFAPPMHPADELAAADVVVIPSRWESGPLVLTEAIALGRPVVATRVGMVPDMVADGQSGWIVAPSDSAALGAALIDALRDPAEAARRARAASQRAAAILDTPSRVALVEDVYRASLVRS